MVRSLVVPSSLASEGLEEKKLQEVDNMLMVYRAALDLFWQEVDHVRKSRNFNKVCNRFFYLSVNEASMFRLFHPLTHFLHITRDVSLLEVQCYDPWEYIQLSTGRLSYSQYGFGIWYA